MRPQAGQDSRCSSQPGWGCRAQEWLGLQEKGKVNLHLLLWLWRRGAQPVRLEPGPRDVPPPRLHTQDKEAEGQGKVRRPVLQKL